MSNHYKDLGLPYEVALHGVQSAIRYELENTVPPRTMEEHAKHLRTGLDGRASDAMGLATLLIEKGVFTKEEYAEHMRLAMNTELAQYEDYVRTKFNLPTSMSFR